jgi:penicillin-binding protein 1B
VFTTLDPLLQEKAEKSLAAELERLEKDGRKASRGLAGRRLVDVAADRRGASVVVGAPRSIVRWLQSRAGARSDPSGRSRKPLVYLAALEQGTYTPATCVLDEPVELKLQNGQTWKPENFTKNATAR